MKHVSTQDISDFLDGTLSVSRMRDVAIHMAQCLPCNTELEAWKKTRAMLRRAPRSVTPGDDFWAATTARLAEEDKSVVPAPALTFRTSSPSFKTGLTAVLGTAAAMVGLVFFVGHTPSIPHIPPTPSVVSDTIDAADVSSFVQAHTEAAAVLPLADGSRQIMLATDVDDQSDSSAGDTTTNADTNL